MNQVSQSHTKSPQTRPSFAEVVIEEKFKRQACGFITTIIILIVFCLAAVGNVVSAFNQLFEKNTTFNWEKFASLVFDFSASSINATFFGSALLKPEFLAGNPDRKKFLPVAIGLALAFVSRTIDPLHSEPLYRAFGAFAVFGFLLFLMYFNADESKSLCNCFKPWVITSVTSCPGLEHPPKYDQHPPKDQMNEIPAV
jgi:hypothetical protein